MRLYIRLGLNKDITMHTQSLDKGTIVCIEDEPEMVQVIKMILNRSGYTVIGALGGQEGLDTISEIRPDLVLLDLMMPRMDGWQVYSQMKETEGLGNIPVIIVTARAQSIDKRMALDVAKVQDYITKPFRARDLVQSVRRVLGNSSWDLPGSGAGLC
jgi:two-component system response regulator VicR